jgi:hypothetical protein
MNIERTSLAKTNDLLRERVDLLVEALDNALNASPSDAFARAHAQLVLATTQRMLSQQRAGAEAGGSRSLDRAAA